MLGALVLCCGAVLTGLPGATDLSGASPQAPATDETGPRPYGFFSVPQQTAATVTPAPIAGQSSIAFNPKTMGIVVEEGMDRAETVALQVSISPPPTSASLKVFPSGTTAPTSGAMRYVAGEANTQFVTSDLGADDQVVISNEGTGSVQISVTVVGFWGTSYCPNGVCALFGTISTPQATTVLDRFAAPMGNGADVDVPASAADLPTSAAYAVFVVTAQPNDTPGAIARVAMHPPGGPVDYMDTVLVDDDETHQVMTVGVVNGSAAISVSPYNESTPVGSVRARVSLLGWFDASDMFVPATRLAPSPLQGILEPNQEQPIVARGLDGVPPEATHVLLNLRVTGKDAGGVVQVGGIDQLSVTPELPGGIVRPTNNTVLAPLGSELGEFSVKYVPGGSTVEAIEAHAEVVGWVERVGYSTPTQGSIYRSIAPSTIVAPRWGGYGQVPLLERQVVGPDGNPVIPAVPVSGVSHVMLSVQTWGTQATTSVTVWGKGRPRPAQPSVVLTAARGDGGYVMADVGSDGKINIDVGSAALQVEISVVGYFTPYMGSPTTGPNVVVIGDSITELTRATVYLENQNEMRLRQQGNPGFLTGDQRWYSHQVGFSRPDQAIINLGTNDVWRHAFTAPNHDPESTPSRVLQHYDKMKADLGADCITYVNTNQALTVDQGIEARRAADPAHVGRIDWAGLTAKYKHTNDPATKWLTRDWIGHPSDAGIEAIALLYDYAITGTVDPAGTIFASQTRPAELVTTAPWPVDWSQWVQRCGQ